MNTNWITVKGIVIEGYRVASQPSREYPYGTLEKQIPFFRALGLDLDKMYNGTLNISISPNTFAMTNPEYTFERVAWTDLHPPETFSFSRCTVSFHGMEYAGWVYHPHPETKKRHFQHSSLIEILTTKLPDIHYGDQVQIKLNPEEISIT